MQPKIAPFHSMWSRQTNTLDSHSLALDLLTLHLLSPPAILNFSLPTLFYKKGLKKNDVAMDMTSFLPLGPQLSLFSQLQLSIPFQSCKD